MRAVIENVFGVLGAVVILSYFGIPLLLAPLIGWEAAVAFTIAVGGGGAFLVAMLTIMGAGWLK